MPFAETITIASLNTQMGRAIREPYGLKPLDGVDILLMQEVMMGGSELVDRVHDQIGLRIGQYDEELGLAIALLPGQFITKHYKTVMQQRGLIGNSIDSNKEDMQKSRFRLRGRGLIGVSLVTSENNALSVATTHPTVQLRQISRNRQVRKIAGAVAKVDHPLVLAGDMNHWPGPHSVDLRTYEETRLTPVNMPDKATFDVSRTRYAWLGKLAANFGVDMNGQLDAMLYRGLTVGATTLVDVSSDHSAIMTTFVLES